MNIFLFVARANNIQSFRCKAHPLRPRKRPQRSISRTFYANDRWLRRPGPWPGLGAVTFYANNRWLRRPGPFPGLGAVTPSNLKIKMVME